MVVALVRVIGGGKVVGGLVGASVGDVVGGAFVGLGVEGGSFFLGGAKVVVDDVVQVAGGGKVGGGRVGAGVSAGTRLGLVDIVVVSGAGVGTGVRVCPVVVVGGSVVPGPKQLPQVAGQDACNVAPYFASAQRSASAGQVQGPGLHEKGKVVIESASAHPHVL